MSDAKSSSINYTIMSGVDIDSHNIRHQKGLTVLECENVCNNMTNCTGFVHVPAEDICWFKNIEAKNIEKYTVYEKCYKTFYHNQNQHKTQNQQKTQQQLQFYKKSGILF